MVTTSSIPVHASQMEAVGQELCFSGWACQLWALLTDLGLLLLAATATVFLILTLGYIQSARSITQEEQSRTAAERDAFLRFVGQIKEVETQAPAAMQPTANVGISTMSADASQQKSLDQVRQAYRETVMAVPHYDEDYGEPLLENLAIEFGEDVAQMVANGSRLTPQLQQILVSKAKQAAHERVRLMSSLEREEAYLVDAEDTFNSVQEALDDYNEESLRVTPYQRFSDLWERLETLEEDSRSLIQERQEQIHDEPLNDWSRSEGLVFAEYLYDPLDVDYPVLRTGAEMVERIERARQSLISAVGQQV